MKLMSYLLETAVPFASAMPGGPEGTAYVVVEGDGQIETE